jgi:hypothetical protein
MNASVGRWRKWATVDREDFLRVLSGERSRRGEEAGRGFPPHAYVRKGEDSW